MRKTSLLLPVLLGLALPSLAQAKRTDSAKFAAKAVREKGPKEKAPCYAPEVHVVRRRGSDVEHRDLSLTLCDGSVNPAALDSVSVLARPRDVERPPLSEIRAYQKRPVEARGSAREQKSNRGPKTKRRNPAYLTENVLRIHPGLLERLQRVANRFPGKTIEIISGHRPDARYTSRHHHGRALDMRVEGVSREMLRDFLRKFDETGVGYYPNSYFVHMDVRDDRGYWVDRSGPGEPADYGPWPPRKNEVDRASAKMVASALSDLDALRENVVNADTMGVEDEAEAEPRLERPRRRQPAQEAAPEEDGDLETEEIERIRKDAMEAIRAL
jgi:uncharacterized protein YcbK (DUF882 family)